MAYTDTIAHAAPFSGAPVITAPSVYGAAPGKPFLWRIPVLGERPIRISVDGLPEGLVLVENRVSGTTSQEGCFSVTVRAANALGIAEKAVTLMLGDDMVLRTPLMGFTTWNAVLSDVNDAFVRQTADLLVSSGLAEYGYSYVNIDSGWQGDYGGELDAVQPSGKFPDMKALTDYLHVYGFKCGIYSSPFLEPWGCPAERTSIPGCTRGEPDERFSLFNRGIGVEHLEENNARQWAEWGFDYLKYDWTPTQPVNAAPMKEALSRQPREFAYCTTVHCDPLYAHWWQKYTNSWRDNTDTFDLWPNIKERVATCDVWEKYVTQGHFYDLDMLAVGAMGWNGGKTRMTPDEALFHVSLHMFFPSPVQISCLLDALTPYEFDLLANEEVLAVNQDELCVYPRLIREYCTETRNLRVYERPLENGDTAYAVFNMGDASDEGTVQMPCISRIRDMWQKKDLPASDRLEWSAAPHSARLFRVSH